VADAEQAGGKPARNLESAGRTFGFAAVVLLAVGADVAIVEVYPGTVPAARNTSFVDIIFASRMVIVAMRVVLLFAAAYVAMSMVGLIASRRWIAELGPFKASDPIALIGQSAGVFEADLADAVETVAALKRRLDASDEALAAARSEVADLLDQIATIDAQHGRADAT